MNTPTKIKILLFFFISTQISYSQERCLPPAPFDVDAQYTRSIYVSPSGNDSSGQGTTEQPYRTLERAVRNLQPGTEIHLAAGNYPPNNYFSNLKGTSSAPIRITGTDNPADVTFSGGGTGIQLSDPEYLILQNITVRGASGNGINIDDGGSYSTPASHVILRNVYVRDIGPSGNRDGIKLSGLDHFWIENCVIDNPGNDGSGIDMVGCHDGYIYHNHFYNMANSGVQAKGGSARVLIYANLFHNGGLRAVNMGGSTGLDFFRPIDAPYEASHIDVISNLFLACDTPVAFVGCQSGIFAHNVVYKPNRWAARILQETTGSRFVQSGNNLFVNNIVILDERVSTLINIGPNTKPETFIFANNLWYNTSRNLGNLSLPGQVKNNIVQQDPQFIDPIAENFRLQSTSPSIGKGIYLQTIAAEIGRTETLSIGDYTGACWNDPPTLGIHEMQQTNHQNWKMEK